MKFHFFIFFVLCAYTKGTIEIFDNQPKIPPILLLEFEQIPEGPEYVNDFIKEYVKDFNDLINKFNNLSLGYEVEMESLAQNQIQVQKSIGRSIMQNCEKKNKMSAIRCIAKYKEEFQGAPRGISDCTDRLYNEFNKLTFKLGESSNDVLKYLLELRDRINECQKEDGWKKIWCFTTNAGKIWDSLIYVYNNAQAIFMVFKNEGEQFINAVKSCFEDDIQKRSLSIYQNI